jgi:hypothetical protein
VNAAGGFGDGTEAGEAGGPRKGRGEELEPSRVEEGAIPPSKLFTLAEVTDEKAEAGDLFKEGGGGWGLHGAARRIRRQGNLCSRVEKHEWQAFEALTCVLL